MLKRPAKTRLVLTVLLACSFLLMAGVIPPVEATSLSPATYEAILDMPVTYTATGLNTSESYKVTLDGANIHTGLTPTSGGELVFSVTVTTVGSHTVVIVGEVMTADTASATIVGLDIVAQIMPMLILYVTFAILFGVVAAIKIT